MKNILLTVTSLFLSSWAFAGGGTVGNQRGDSFLDDLKGYYDMPHSEDCPTYDRQRDGGNRIAGKSSITGITVVIPLDMDLTQGDAEYFRFRAGRGSFEWGEAGDYYLSRWTTDENKRESTKIIYRRNTPNDKWTEYFKATLQVIDEDHVDLHLGWGTRVCRLIRK